MNWRLVALFLVIVVFTVLYGMGLKALIEWKESQPKEQVQCVQT